MALQQQELERLFRRLDGSGGRFPGRTALAERLTDLLGRDESAVLKEDDAALFATAAVEMWQRGVHSLIAALAMSKSSEIWTSVSGYYASHYSVRAIAHLLGYFALFRRRLFLEISPWGNRYRCNPVDSLPKTTRGEHQFYWVVVRRMPGFDRDALFTDNSDRISSSDASHRGVASYVDHLDKFLPYEASSKDQIKRQMVDLAQTALAAGAAVTIPDREQYPQIGAVLSLAYLRIYRFREYLDSLLPRRGSFWSRHRTPPWCTDLLVFPPRPD